MQYFAAMIAIAGLLAGQPCRAEEAQTQGGDIAAHVAGGKRSGYVFADPATRAMQDDEFQNPGLLWVETGKQLWLSADGAAGKSCQSCHGDAAPSMKGIATAYPKFDAHVGKVIDIEQRINLCREGGMGAKPYAWESRELLSLTAFVKNQSSGLPMKVAVDGPAAPFFEKGRAQFSQARGPRGQSCAACHDDAEGGGRNQGQTNGFPAYRLSWQALGSAQRQIQSCEKSLGVAPHPPGAADDVDLELYLAWRGAGLPVETPAVRK